ILKALSFEPTARYQRARDFGEELARALLAEPAKHLIDHLTLEEPLSEIPTQFQNEVLEEPPSPVSAERAMYIVLLYKRNANLDQQLVRVLEACLSGFGHQVFVDSNLKVGLESIKEIEERIKKADVVVPLLSAASVSSEMLSYEIQMALDISQQHHGKPRMI